MKIPTNLTLVVLSFAGTGIFAQTTAPAPDPAPAAAAPWTVGSIKISGLIDGYYSKNFGNPASGNNVLRNFDVKANSMTLNMTKLTFEHDADPVGFKIDVGFGRAWEIFHATDPAGTDIVRYIPQAYVSLKPKNAGGLQIDFGKFYTSAGAELTETHLSGNYSRGYLYANGPYYHTGLRVTKPLTKSFSAGFQLVNGWNNVEDNNSGKTLGFTTAWTGSKVSWFNNYYTGPEKTGTNKGFRNFYDTVVNINPNDKTAMYINFDYGADRRLSGGSDTWVAIGIASKFQVSKTVAITPRYEHYNDRDGFITGKAQKLNTFTMTGEYKWAQGLLSRLEYRKDWSNQPYFDRGNENGSAKSQSTLLIGFVAYFGM
jgi:hypothetical protein